MTYAPNIPQRSAQAKYRAAILDFADGHRFTHWVTLNTHRSLTLPQAAGFLKRWRVEVFRRLHGRRFFDSPADQLTYYIGCPEDSGSGHPHFHLACAVPDGLHEKFVVVAAERWLAIVRSGTFHCDPIGADPNAHRIRLGYASKQMYRGSELPFVDSRVYR